MQHYSTEYGSSLREEEPDEESILPVHQEPIFTSNGELLIALYDEILSDNYVPPFDNLTGLQFHLYALWTFYNVVRPEEITLETLLKLDLATIRLISIAAPAAVLMKPITAKKKQRRGVQGGKARQKETTRQDVFDAYKSMGAYWTDGIKPITVGEESFSISGFALKQIIIQAGVNLDQKTVIGHLKELKKDGII